MSKIGKLLANTKVKITTDLIKILKHDFGEFLNKTPEIKSKIPILKEFKNIEKRGGSKRIFDYLYKDAIIYLQRKYNKFNIINNH